MAKRFIFLANIGTSDIKELKKEKEKFFEVTKKFLKENKWDNLTLGILEPEIEELEKRYENFPSSKIFLFGTKQKSSHAQDTIYAAEIAKRKIISRFNLDEEEVEVIPIKKNPADFDKMQTFYKDFLEELKEILNENTDLIVSITGGTPAQNFSLLLNSIFLFPEKVKAVYLFKGQKKPKFLNINQEIFNEIVKKQIQILKENELFYPSIKLIEKWPSSFTYDEKIKLEFFSAISQFNFQKAKEILKRYPRLFSETEKEKLEKYLKFPQLLKGRKVTKKYLEIYLDIILEIWKDAKKKWKQGEYIDFLIRFNRTREGIIKIAFEFSTKVFISQKNDKGEFPEWKEYLKREKLEEKFSDKPRIEDLSKILNMKKEELKISQKFLNWINDTKKLRELRNIAIAIHGFEGISEEKIHREAKKGLRKSQKSNLVEWTEEILEEIKSQLGKE